MPKYKPTDDGTVVGGKIVVYMGRAPPSTALLDKSAKAAVGKATAAMLASAAKSGAACFVIPRPPRSWIEIELHDDDGKPVREERYVVVDAEGAEYEGQLDDEGYARVENLAEGMAKVGFPNLDEPEWVAFGAPRPARKAAKTPEAWIEIELIGEDGRPQPGERYRVIAPAGNVFDGRLDEQGWARVEGLEEGEVRVYFPDCDEPEVVYKAAAPPAAETPPPHAWIELEVVGEDGRPAPDERYRVILPDGKTREGTLDAAGFARIEGLPEGELRVAFPDMDEPEVVYKGARPQRSEEKLDAFIELALTDEQGDPLPGEAYRLVTAGGRVLEGRLDERGVARVEALEHGDVHVSFPALDAAEWAPAAR
jgi:hypothetical protein